MAILKNGRKLHYRTCVECGKPYYTAARYSAVKLCYECANRNVKPSKGRKTMAIPEIDIQELKKDLRK